MHNELVSRRCGKRKKSGPRSNGLIFSVKIVLPRTDASEKLESGISRDQPREREREVERERERSDANQCKGRKWLEAQFGDGEDSRGTQLSGVMRFLRRLC